MTTPNQINEVVNKNVNQNQNSNQQVPNNNTQQQQQTTDQNQQNQQQNQTLTAADILKRTSKDASGSSQKQEGSDDPQFNSSDIDKIQDPTTRKMVQDLYKHFEKGFNKKFMEVADLRKKLEGQMQEINNWSPQRLQQELAKPDFIQAMQFLQQQSAPQNWTGSQEEWSALSPQEQQRFKGLEQAVLSQQQQFERMLQDQEDERLKSSYPDYNPDLVNKLREDLIQGRYQATREDLWKVYNHDTNVARAYELGLKDGQAKLQQKQDGTSITGGFSVTNGNDLPADVNKKDFVAIAKARLAQAKQKIMK